MSPRANRWEKGHSGIADPSSVESKGGQRNCHEADDNRSALRETRSLQRKTLEAVERARKRAVESKEVGTSTLEILREQGERLGSTQGAAARLTDELRRADKLQSKFAAWGMRLGSRRRAKKELKAEERGEGIRKKAPGVASRSTTPRTASLSSSNGKNSKSAKNADLPAASSAVAPLSQSEQKELAEIDADDRLVDEGIDALSQEVDDLLALSKMMGDEARGHNEKLDSICGELGRASSKSKVVNRRAKMFMRS